MENMYSPAKFVNFVYKKIICVKRGKVTTFELRLP